MPEALEDLRLKRIMDELYLIDPCLGTRCLVTVLARDYQIVANRKRLQRLRQEMGLEAIWCRPPTSIANDKHRKYPYLLRGLKITRPNHVWCSDITCIPIPRGSAYLCAVMDWGTRKVLGWAISNTMDAGLCLRTLQQALDTGVVPEIMNTDQSSQFTGEEWIGKLTTSGVKISMDGRGRWMDNVFIERLWRSAKYEEIYLKENATIPTLEAGMGQWFMRYNTWRPHAALGNRTPQAVYIEDGAPPANDRSKASPTEAS